MNSLFTNKLKIFLRCMKCGVLCVLFCREEAVTGAAIGNTNKTKVSEALPLNPRTLEVLSKKEARLLSRCVHRTFKRLLLPSFFILSLSLLLSTPPYSALLPSPSHAPSTSLPLTSTLLSFHLAALLLRCAETAGVTLKEYVSKISCTSPEWKWLGSFQKN